MELDQFMKEFVVDFPKETMELFFPHLARFCDFSKTKDLNKELYTKSPQGTERFVDVLLEIEYQESPSVLLVHVESQQQRRFDFPARMLAYQCMIYEREIERSRRDSFTRAEFTEWENRKRLLSFVFCNYALESGITQEEYKIGLPESNLNCRYTCISLPVLSAKEYLQKNNPVVCALVVFMKRYGLSKPELKVSGYRKLLPYMQDLTTRQINLIVYALETYLTLTKEEEQIYQQLIKEIYPEVNEMITNPLIEQGRQQGRQQGIQQGLQESVITLLTHRFRQTPQDLQNKIYSISDVQKLRKLLNASLLVPSLDELTQNGLFDE